VVLAVLLALAVSALLRLERLVTQEHLGPEERAAMALLSMVVPVERLAPVLRALVLRRPVVAPWVQADRLDQADPVDQRALAEFRGIQ
jgi:hypothetical protein